MFSFDKKKKGFSSLKHLISDIFRVGHLMMGFQKTYCDDKTVKKLL